MPTTNLKLAFATCAEIPSFYPDDKHVADVLGQRNVVVEPLVWDNPNVDWSTYDAVVIRSCWDYHLCPTDFLAWVDHLAAQHIRVLNNPVLLRWNHDKSYLQDLIAQGIPVVPTQWFQQGTTPSLQSILESRIWDKAVVKPTISATAYHTWITTRSKAHQHETRFQDLVTTRDVMIQPFIPEIQTRGEWSLMFFGGRFSHAVVKRPKPGDFRVQDNFGGTTALATPNKATLTIAQQVLTALDHKTVYARIDGVETAAGFQIMEVELIEPSLFLSEHPLAPTRFADAIEAACQ